MIESTKSESPGVEQAVAHFLATGESDPIGTSFPGRHALERIRACERILRAALVKEVQQRARGREHKHAPPNTNSTAWVRHKIAPMIHGLFRADECETVLAAAERSIVFLTRESIERIIREAADLETAWTIANMYLYSLRAPSLSDKVKPVGLSIETTCYVSLEYFAEEDPFADYVVHEVAHISHNCKRRTLGLAHSRTKEWLLDIAFAKRGNVRLRLRDLQPYSGADTRKSRTDRASSALRNRCEPGGSSCQSGRAAGGLGRRR